MTMAPASPPTVGRLILDYLRLEGVTHIFGVPGGGIMGMLEELYSTTQDLPYIVCRQETGAAYMADGYFRASGKLGVVLVTTGPGATNAITGVMNAEASGSAMLVLTGEIAEQFFGMGYLQEGVDGKLDVNAMFRAGCASSEIMVAASSAGRMIEAALRTALSLPRHAAHLSLPWDVTMAPAATQVPASPGLYKAARAVADQAMVDQTLDVLRQSKRPLLFLGNGCRAALRDPATLAALTSLVESRALPVVTTADGKGIFPDSHPQSLRSFGLANSIWPYYWMTQTAPAPSPAYDALVIIGSGMGELATDKWNPLLKPNGKIVQLDANSRIIGRDFPVDLGIVGEAGDFIARLAKAAETADWDAAEIAARRKALADIKAQHSPFDDPAAYASTAGPIHPAALCRVLQEELEGKPSILMLDAGNCVGWGVHYLKGGPDLEIHPALNMGPMGFAVGAVVGAKLARPQDICIALTGDGAFMMQGSEISTAQRNNIGAIWIVLQDNDLAMVSQGMEVAAKGDTAIQNDPAVWKQMFSLGSPDLVKYAQGLGADAVLVNDPDAFRNSLTAAITAAQTGRPQVIVAAIDRGAMPPYYQALYHPKK